MLLFGMISAEADQSIAPVPFEIQSNDGSRVFCFNPYPDKGSERAVVYDNSDPPIVIYTVKGLIPWAYKFNFYFSEDFQNFVFFYPVGFNIAFEFYVNGELQKIYYIEDFIKDTSLIPKSSSKAMWLATGEQKITQNGNILTFRTTVCRFAYILM